MQFFYGCTRVLLCERAVGSSCTTVGGMGQCDAHAMCGMFLCVAAFYICSHSSAVYVHTAVPCALSLSKCLLLPFVSFHATCTVGMHLVQSSAMNSLFRLILVLIFRAFVLGINVSSGSMSCS